MTRRVTILTDFGTVDGYVGAMKAVLAERCPGSISEDVSHDVPRGDVRRAMWSLRRYWRLYPEGTVHLVVVDPGVGTDRRPLAVEAEGRYVVAPDNGVVTSILDDADEWSAVTIRDVRAPVARVSTTFHGRDVFAPAAAHLASGGALDGLGAPVDDPVRLDEPEPVGVAGAGEGVVVQVDRFGNLVTNLPGEWLVEDTVVEVAGRTIAPAPAYGHVEEGDLVVVVDSDDRVEVAVRDGSAAERLRIGIGEPVRLRTSRGA